MGVDVRQYYLKDSQGNLGEPASVFLVLPNNVGPMIFSDDYELKKDMPAVLDVLANDIDPNGDAIFINSLIFDPLNCPGLNVELTSPATKTEAYFHGLYKRVLVTPMAQQRSNLWTPPSDSAVDACMFAYTATDNELTSPP